MRLICPNCNAQYEIEDHAIPDGGRDVQCSGCGHVWFRTSAAVPVQEEAQEEAQAVPQPVSDTAAEHMGGAAEADADARPPLDETVKSVLREEAQREAGVRRSGDAAPRRQEQGAVRKPAAGGAQGDETAAIHDGLSAMIAGERRAEPVPAAPNRRVLLPDMEEINSPLRAAPKRESAGEAHGKGSAIAMARRRHYRTGFLMMPALLALGVVVYAGASGISAAFPAAEPALDAYVQAVDRARVGLDSARFAAVQGVSAFLGGN